MMGQKDEELKKKKKKLLFGGGQRALVLSWQKDWLETLWCPSIISISLLGCVESSLIRRKSNLHFVYYWCVFGLGLKMKIISLFSLFLLLFMGHTALFGIIYRVSTVLFQLIFTFIYNIFNNNFSVSTKYAVSKHILIIIFENSRFLLV